MSRIGPRFERRWVGRGDLDCRLPIFDCRSEGGRARLDSEPKTTSVFERRTLDFELDHGYRTHGVKNRPKKPLSRAKSGVKWGGSA